MKKNKTVFAGLVVAALFFAGCSKEPLDHITPEESRIYITNYDSAADFNSFKTYNVSDSVAVIKDGQSTKEVTNTDLAYIAAVDKYMQANGYVKVDKNQNPDLALTVNRIYNTTTGVIDYNNYWDYYGGYWDPYYWGYGGFGYYVPYGYAIYSITEGALSIDILDLKNAKNSNTIDIIWTGLIRGEGILDAANADSQVKALFDQSPYLKTNL